MSIPDHDPENNNISDPGPTLEGAISRPNQPLTRYEAARSALAEARRIDEIKDIRDKAVALKAYAHQAKDTELVEHATEIKLRAERRAGEMLAEMEKNKGGGEPGVGRAGKNAVPSRDRITAPPTLSDLGVNKKQSSKWQKLAELPEDKFEAEVKHAMARARGATTGASNIWKRQRAPTSPKPEPKPAKAPPSADPTDIVIDEIRKKCIDGKRWSADKIATAVKRARTAVLEALRRMKEEGGVEQWRIGKGADAFEYRIAGGSEACLRRELAAKDRRIAELEAKVAELEGLLELATAPTPVAPPPDSAPQGRLH